MARNLQVHHRISRPSSGHHLWFFAPPPQAGTDYILREYTSKDAKVEELKVFVNGHEVILYCGYHFMFTIQVPSSFLTDPNKLNDVLPIRELALHKITLPR